MSAIAAPNVIHVQFGHTCFTDRYKTEIQPCITSNPYVAQPCATTNSPGYLVVGDVVEKLIYSGLYTILCTGYDCGQIVSFILLKAK